LSAAASQADAAPGPMGGVGRPGIERAAAGAGRAAEGDVAAVDPDQDADDAGAVDRPDSRARVVVAEDRLVAVAVKRVAVGAVLPHSHPVPEAVPPDDPGDARRGGGWSQQQQSGDHDCEAIAHDRSTISPWASRGLL